MLYSYAGKKQYLWGMKIITNMRRVLITLLCAVALFSIADATAKEKREPIRNVIFMIGDGMGLAQATMVMIENGYEATAFDRAENVALIKTYSSNNRVTDSAASGTALASGKKTNNKMIGLTPELDTCYSIAYKAKAKGMSTGLVVACEVQHATPAAFYAHAKDRNDKKTITKQLANNNYLDLVVGGGLKSFETESMSEVAKSNGFNLVKSFDELKSAPDGRTLGLFTAGHIEAISKRGDYLPEATAEALRRLSSNKKGFFLMVEGSQIDWACHSNNAQRCLAETKDFCKSIEVAMDFADKNPGTLIVITADHETGGLSAVSGDEDFTKSDSGVEYKFSTKGHSGILVPAYMYGTGANQINGVLDNTELSDLISKCLGL